MGTEIERKFLLADDSWRTLADTGTHMVQGYLVDADAFRRGQALASVRVRIHGDTACLNVKSAQLGIARQEYEYPLPLADARKMLDTLCRGCVEKVRHRVPMDGHVFEIDEFLGDNRGLVVAEVELAHADEAHPHPAWLGREVSHLPRYYNVNLIDHPWRAWNHAERLGQETR